MNLEKETRKLLAKHMKTCTLEKTSREAGVGFYWLQSFKRYPDSGANVRHVQKLYDYLNGNG
jgi:hypothetical protein